MAHIDPRTGEMVSCERTWTQPVKFSQQLKKVMVESGKTIKEMSVLLKKPEGDIRMMLWLAEQPRQTQIDYLCDVFIEKIGEKIDDEEWLGKLKAILKEMMEMTYQSVEMVSDKSTEA